MLRGSLLRGDSLRGNMLRGTTATTLRARLAGCGDGTTRRPANGTARLTAAQRSLARLARRRNAGLASCTRRTGCARLLQARRGNTGLTGRAWGALRARLQAGRRDTRLTGRARCTGRTWLQARLNDARAWRTRATLDARLLAGLNDARADRTWRTRLQARLNNTRAWRTWATLDARLLVG